MTALLKGSMIPYTAFAIWTKEIKCVAKTIAKMIWGKSFVIVDNNESYHAFSSSLLPQTKRQNVNIVPQMANIMIHCFILSSTCLGQLLISWMKYQSKRRSIILEINTCKLFLSLHIFCKSSIPISNKRNYIKSYLICKLLMYCTRGTHCNL